MQKLKKVTLEYSDGEIRTLSGKQANEWMHQTNGAIVLGVVHGATFPKYSWKSNLTISNLKCKNEK